MKRFVFGAVFSVCSLVMIAPALGAKQISTPGQLAEGSTITDLVQHNRDVRNKK